MRAISFIILLFGLLAQVNAQYGLNNYGPSAEFPFGKPNPTAAPEIWDFYELTGHCDCISQQRDESGEWAEPMDMSWTFRYILDGHAIQDEMIKSDGKHKTSVRQFNSESDAWVSSAFSNSEIVPVSSLAGPGRADNRMIMERAQFNSDGQPGVHRVEFYDISEGGFKWKSSWISNDGQTIIENWRIECIKWPDTP